MAKLLGGTRIYGTANVDSTLYVGNSTVNVITSPGSVTINGSSGQVFKANNTQFTLGSSVSFSANGSLGSAGYVLTSSGSSVYWDAPSAASSFDYGLSYAINKVAF